MSPTADFPTVISDRRDREATMSCPPTLLMIFKWTHLSLSLTLKGTLPHCHLQLLSPQVLGGVPIGSAFPQLSWGKIPKNSMTTVTHGPEASSLRTQCSEESPCSLPAGLCPLTPHPTPAGQNSVSKAAPPMKGQRGETSSLSGCLGLQPSPLALDPGLSPRTS